EAYLERGPRGVTLIDRHEEAGDRCDGVPRKRSWDARHLFSLVVLAAAVVIALALFGYSVFHGNASPVPPDAMVDSGSMTTPIDAPGDAGRSTLPVDAPPERHPVPTAPVIETGPGCATLTPAITYPGFVPEYTSPATYGDATCHQSLTIGIDDYSSL